MPFQHKLPCCIWTITCIILLKILQVGCNSCSISRYTVEIVDNCPDNESKWKAAAARKNCAAYASQCNKPEKLVYHCVLNTYANRTLEVCAYAQNIVLGFCTEYSAKENMIQQNFGLFCLTFKKTPCPIFYRSDEAYKYIGCFQQARRVTTVNSSLKSINVPGDVISVNTTSIIPFKTDVNVPRKEQRTTPNTAFIWKYLGPVILIVLIISWVFLIFILLKMTQHKANSKAKSEAESIYKSLS